eukprot:CAMPEP_0197038030 /NCGR_PEP_ID=MMETSP1384-20130603/15084_1 /TAXON_ID=29189 /ORGANISM="Ammonia sp." /LENGTH=495 /DNA_ID=CAMNT_0042468421 /DNA_START=19 /DNA_END=1506 /DNA_ORIENTATION=+
MDRCKTVEDVLRRMEFDGVEYVRFEASNCNGQSFGKTIPARHVKSMFKTGLPVFCGTWFYTVTFGIDPVDTVAEGVTFRNCFNFPYPETYCVLPYCTQSKVARIMMYPMIKLGDSVQYEAWPLDPRTICLQQLKQLHSMGYSLFSAFEHEFQVIDSNNNEPLWSGKEFCGTNKFALHQDFAFELEKHLYRMGIDVEQMHVEYSPGQYELPMKASWGIAAADNSFTFRNSIKQIAAQKGYTATFATTPFPDNIQGASNGAHFNFSLWTNSNKQQKNQGNTDEKESAEKPKDAASDEKKGSNDSDAKVNAFYDETSKNRLSEVAMYFIGGVLEHINAITIFSNITANCYRRTNTHAWAPGNASYGRNNRTVLIRCKTEGNKGTYLEFRLSPSACNPYMVTASVLAAGIDGIKNKIQPKYGECTKDAMGADYEHIPKLPKDLSEAMEALKKDKIIWNAFGERFCTMLINTKTLELKELEDLAKQIGREKAETKMFLDI